MTTTQEPRQLAASVGQRLVWLMDHYRGQDGLLNEPIIWRLRGPLDRAALQSAVDGLAERHEALRTTFSARGRRLLQVVHPPGPVRIAFGDLGGEPDPDAALRAALPGEVRGRIDPADWPIRVMLWRLGADDHVLCFNMHHLITDDRSGRVLAADLVRLYNHARGGPALPPTGWSYSEWSRWQAELLSGESLHRLRSYWDRQLAGVQFPALPRRAGRATTSAGKGYGRLDAGVAAAVRTLAEARGASVFSVGLALFYAQLHRYTGQHDLAVVSSFLNRTRPEVRETVGYFMNMVMLRGLLEAGEPFAALVDRVHAMVTDAVAHQDLPHQMLPPDLLKTDRDGETVRADDVVFDVLDGKADEVAMDGLTVEPVGFELGVGRVPFELVLVPSGDELVTLLFYGEDKYDPRWADEFLAGYIALAAVATSTPSAPVAALLAQTGGTQW